ncbi:hypothetical protein QP888_04060 [Corynebacterium sp. MSK297]|uniref:hypothetical protein n=1 Tax=Corynebacterium sp. MSK297 TaxID=3050221 RepID=UPI00254F7CF8|nr:hypothetical protein [Corynebacterium sp. MSK297]MDK8845697.1 hypothetical protein [Corynebacterium sp. MSK297]
MPYVLLTLAVIAGAAAVFLWYLDSKQRRAQHQESLAAVEPAEQEGRTTTGAALADDTFSDELISDEPGTTEEHAEWSAQASYGDAPIRGRVLDDEELATAEQLPQHYDVLDVEPVTDDVLADDSGLSEQEIAHETEHDFERDYQFEKSEGERESAREPELDLEQQPGLEQQPDLEQQPELGLEQEQEPKPEPAPEPQSTPVAKPAGPRRDSIIPGALRRERRQWAEKNGFSFAKHDDYLVDEWTRGAAAGGAAPKDIVQGSAYGHEMVLMDLGGVNVMAMRTGAATEIVVDFRRADRDQRTDRTTGEADFDDLLEVGHIGDFTAYATDAAVASRMIDARVVTACDNLPEIVTAVWIESDWVLAQTDKGSHAADWDEMLAPLGLLADAARVLPPRSMAKQILKFDGADPTRMMGPKQPPVFENNQPLRVVPDPQDHPPVQRPSEPVELPTRSKADARGYLEPYALGVDEVDAIADGVDKPDEKGHSKRPHVKRDLSAGPSIFGDDYSGSHD